MERTIPPGLTGSIERDGYLTAEQQLQLEQIQDRAAHKLLSQANNRPENGLHPMAAMATGFGKGRIIHKLITATLKDNPKAKILVIAGTKTTLVDQTHQALTEHQQRDLDEHRYIEAEEDDELIKETTDVDLDITGEKSLLYLPGKFQSGTNVEVETIQKVSSAVNRKQLKPEEYDLVIIDEVHNIGTPKRKQIIDQFNRAVGFTATAYRHSGSMKKPEDYGFEVIESLPLPDAQEMGFLPPLIGMQIDTSQLVEQIPISPSGNIDYSKLEKILKKSPDLRPFIADRLANILRTDSGVFKTTVAVNYVWEAQELAELLKDRGFRVGLAINQADATQIHTDEIPTIGTIERYKLPQQDKKAIDILISPYVASEGFDAPATEVLVWASPTDSPVRYTQYTGRLARRSPGKAFGVVVDCLYQTTQFNYSLNFAMWMKDRVRRLDNRLLYIGPEAKIDEIGRAITIKQLANQLSKQNQKPIQELTQNVILPIQSEEKAINHPYLFKTFVGNTNILRKIANESISIIHEYYPELYPLRIFGNGALVRVFKDDSKLIEVMQDLGAKRQEGYLPIQPGETSINQKYLASTFIGSASKLTKPRDEAIEIINSYYPDLYPVRINDKKRTRVFSDPEKFIEVMQDFGFKLQDKLQPLQPGETAVNKYNLATMFVGRFNGYRQTLSQAFEIIDEYYPDLYPMRIAGRGTRVRAYSDPNKLIEVMQDLGVKLKNPN